LRARTSRRCDARRIEAPARGVVQELFGKEVQMNIVELLERMPAVGRRSDEAVLRDKLSHCLSRPRGDQEAVRKLFSCCRRASRTDAPMVARG
jgi:hypothetical protein